MAGEEEGAVAGGEEDRQSPGDGEKEWQGTHRPLEGDTSTQAQAVVVL